MSPDTLLLSILVIVTLQLLTIMKLSEVNGRLLGIEKKVDTLLAGGTTDPDVPAELEETVVRLETKLAGVPDPVPPA